MANGSRRSSAPVWLFVIAFLVEVALLMFGKLDLATVALLHVGVFSALTFVMFGWDKWRATRGENRVRESTLLFISVIGGALGGLAAMLVVRHKTRRPLFWFVLCVALFVHITIVGWLFVSR
jgi:uncharacterized membrane protein YsdA (DUF1294 family)